LSLNAAMIQALVDKGMSAQDILDIAKASEVKLDRTAAERQARYRDRKKGKRNAVTSRRDPPIERDHTPCSEISSDDEIQNNAPVCVRDDDWPAIPDWVDPTAWNGFLDMRREKRAWPTAHAIDLLLAALTKWRAKGHDPTEILNTSTACNWTGLFEPKDRKNDRSNAFSAKPTTREIGERVAARFAGGSDRVAELVPRLGAPGGHDR
jgi:hypothetical protein